jgi:hypothetical protein
MTTHLGPDWPWRCTFYYSDDVHPPKPPGGLAIQTVHRDTSSRDVELSAGRSRGDIGRIVVEQWTPYGYTTTEDRQHRGRRSGHQ